MLSMQTAPKKSAFSVTENLGLKCFVNTSQIMEVGLGNSAINVLVAKNNLFSISLTMTINLFY